MEPEPGSPLGVGAVVGNTYEVVALVGRGGMGAVWRARHLRLPGKSVAIKVLHGGEITPEAYTRFVSVATYMRLDANGKPWRTAFSFVTDHQPGALHRAIDPFARLGIDLVQLVSRPIPHSPWRYRFDAVLGGHPLDPVVGEAFGEVRARTRQLRVFGSYPADGHS